MQETVLSSRRRVHVGTGSIQFPRSDRRRSDDDERLRLSARVTVLWLPNIASARSCVRVSRSVGLLWMLKPHIRQVG